MIAPIKLPPARCSSGIAKARRRVARLLLPSRSPLQDRVPRAVAWLFAAWVALVAAAHLGFWISARFPRENDANSRQID